MDDVDIDRNLDQPADVGHTQNDYFTYHGLLEEEDDHSDISLPLGSPTVDKTWIDEYLHDYAEDIDFEFVYALHTFVATVEGQANATKGDTMVLLDDSNSYWWLVRVVKDSSIGESLKVHMISSAIAHRTQDTYPPNTLRHQPRGWQD